MREIMERSIAELGKAYRNGSLSPVEVTKDVLDRISATNSILNAFNTVTAEIALERAMRAERELRSWADARHSFRCEGHL